MVLQGETRIYKSNGRSSIYIPAGLINDSAFPFKLEDRLEIRIEGKRLIVERVENPMRKMRG